MVLGSGYTQSKDGFHEILEIFFPFNVPLGLAWDDDIIP